MDVAFRVEEHYCVPESSEYKFKGYWINIGYTELGGWKLPVNDRKLKILNTKISEWLICDEDNDVLRKCTWRKIQV